MVTTKLTNSVKLIPKILSISQCVIGLLLIILGFTMKVCVGGSAYPKSHHISWSISDCNIQKKDNDLRTSTIVLGFMLIISSGLIGVNKFTRVNFGNILPKVLKGINCLIGLLLIIFGFSFQHYDKTKVDSGDIPTTFGGGSVNVKITTRNELKIPVIVLGFIVLGIGATTLANDLMPNKFISK